MFVKQQRPWGHVVEDQGQGGAPPESPSSSDNASAVAELAASLEHRRLYREVTLALRTGLRDAIADFSFLRARGLRSLLKSLLSIADSDAAARLFCQTQSVPELRVVPVLLKNSLRHIKDDSAVNLDSLLSVGPLNIRSPPTNAEITLALRVLEGCCLLHRESAELAHENGAIEVLINILGTRGRHEQGACLNALISLILNSQANQTDFEVLSGMEKVVGLMKDDEGEESLRLKCGEFLLLVVGHISEREETPMSAVRQDIRKLLGEKCASLIWAACQFGSTLDPDQRQTALQIHARRLVESLDQR